MPTFTAWVVTHRFLVIVFWAVVAGCGILAAPATVDRLSFDFSLPGEPSTRASALIDDHFTAGSVNPPLLIVATGPHAQAAATTAAAGARTGLPNSHVIDPTAALMSPDKDLAIALVYPAAVPGPDPYAAARPALSELVRSTRAPEGTTVGTTDFLALADGEAGDDRGLLVELLIGAVGALIVLVLVFGSLLAAAPLLTAGVSILGTFLALLGVTYLGDVSFIVQFLIALIGLGVAIDYALLIVMRWREELAGGADNDEAIRRAMTTAGHSVAVSGLTVAISLSALVLTPAPFLRSVGFGGLLIPLFSVAVALTLLPAVLSLLGPRLLWPRTRPTTTWSRTWAAVARATVRHRWWSVTASTLLLVAMAAPVTGLVLGAPAAQTVVGHGQGTAGTVASQVLDSHVPTGVFRPIDVVVPREDVAAKTAELSRITGVGAVLAPTNAWATGPMARVTVLTRDDAASPTASHALDEIRSVAGPSNVTGGPAEDHDFIHSTYIRGSWVLLVVVGLTFLLLARAVRSLWLPIKALLLNCLSLAAAYGLTVLIWQHGYGTQLLFGTPPAGAIATWVPVAAFAFLFGLSMDYEVFILSRMRESFDHHHDTDQAVVDGLAYTARLVSSAAAILVFAFIALATVPTIEVKILATTLALGIAIDAIIVRGILAPGLVAVLGDRNWTMPTWLARITRTNIERAAVGAQPPSTE